MGQQTSFSSVSEATLLKLAQKSRLLPSSFLIDDLGSERRLVGGGGFGDVYQGNLTSGEHVALKVLRIHVGGTVRDRIEKDFCREALIWRQLKHPNILPFIGISQTAFPGQLCMVAPWMNNGTILSYLESHPASDRKKLLTQAALGLAFLHNRSPTIIHGDVRGANVLIDNNGQACLSDFGSAILTDSLATITSTSVHVRGNIRWIPPEVLNPGNEDFDTVRKHPAVDVYSFAGLCYEIYTGKVPYYEQRAGGAVMMAVMEGLRPKRPDVNLILDDLSDSTWNCMEKCWSQNPASRPTIQEVIMTLENAGPNVCSRWSCR
ncbi:kinase-like protein [Gymnopus androsaceus JB14]|uniref:Kinase-like protein n=1 Tax=Gymnopus androsaceus JB14 TaxID=1447944 RepID=A0A6A4HCF6_9AGAR|nr:kinase-like protein [Gymnopus androsaceus JB14]